MKSTINTSIIKIKEKIQESGIPIETFADACGISVKQLEYNLRAYREMPIHCYVKIAELLNTNIDFLIGRTEIDDADETYCIDLKLTEARKRKGLTMLRASQILRCTQQKISENEHKGMIYGLKSLLAYAQGYQTSTDYILGLTPYVTWEEYYDHKHAFHNIQPGEAAYIEEKDMFVLLCTDGEHVCLPDGTVVTRSDDIFHNIKTTSMGKTLSEFKLVTTELEELKNERKGYFYL